MNRRQLLQKSSLAAVAAATVPVAATAAAGTAAARPASAFTVEAVQMPAWRNEAGARVPLSPGDTVNPQQEVQTGEKAGLVLRVPEGSLVRLGEKTQLGIQRLEVQEVEGRTAVRSQLRVFEGFFRFTTSTVAKVLGDRQIDVGVRTATIGIRGTDFWAMTDDKHDAACLFEGNVALETRDQGALTLDKPTAFWARFFDQPVKPVGNATPDELAKFLASTELKPGQGVAVPGGRWRVVAAALPAVAGAQQLAARLRGEGYPAVVKLRKGQHEVRLNGLASRADAEAVLAKVAGIAGVNGRVALSA
jgi:hypothetical protein